MVNCRKCGDDLAGCPKCKPLPPPPPPADYEVADAGRALVRCLWQDYIGTVRQLARLRDAQRAELADALTNYYRSRKATIRMTREEVLQSWEIDQAGLTAPAKQGGDAERGTIPHDASIIG